VNCDHFFGKQVVVTEKMDGENTSMYRTAGVHARSTSSSKHPSRSWVKELQARIRNDIPEGWRVCGENLYAQHSVKYSNLESYFHVFSIWNEQNVALSWDDTLEWCELLGLKPVRELWRGLWSEANIKSAWDTFENKDRSEGYVVRLADEFRFEDFSVSLAKWVRTNHVQTDIHWMHKEVTPNSL